MNDRPSTTPLAAISSFNVPDTHQNNLETSDSDDKEQKCVDEQTSAAEKAVMPDMASSLQTTPQIKSNAEGVPTLKKKQQ